MVWPFTKRLTDDEAITLATMSGADIRTIYGLTYTEENGECWYEVRSATRGSIDVEQMWRYRSLRQGVNQVDWVPIAQTYAEACRVHLNHHNITLDGPCAGLGRTLKNWWQRALTSSKPAP